jgi:hypothetical protein
MYKVWHLIEFEKFKLWNARRKIAWTHNIKGRD